MVLTHTWTAVVGGSNVCAVFEEEEIDFRVNPSRPVIAEQILTTKLRKFSGQTLKFFP